MSGGLGLTTYPPVTNFQQCTVYVAKIMKIEKIMKVDKVIDQKGAVFLAHHGTM